MRQPARVAIATVVAGLALLLPLAGSPALSASELAAVSLLVLALASALHDAPRPVTLFLVQVLSRPAAGDPGLPALSSRATDPTHHPLAPRAPGLG